MASGGARAGASVKLQLGLLYKGYTCVSVNYQSSALDSCNTMLYMLEYVTSGSCLPSQFAGDVEEGLFEVVVRFGRDVVVLEVLFAVKMDILRLHLSVLAVDLVADQDNRDVLTDTDKIFVPVRNTLVGDTSSHVKHDNSSLCGNIGVVCKCSKTFANMFFFHPHPEIIIPQHSRHFIRSNSVRWIHQTTPCSTDSRVNEKWGKLAKKRRRTP